MTATHAPFTFYAGNTWVIDAAMHDAAGGPLDLTGAVVEWRLFLHGTKMASLTGSNGIVITDAAKGLCRITFPAAQSAALGVGNYTDEVRVTLPDATVCTQAVGAIVVAAPGASAGPPDLAAQLRALKNARRAGIRRTKIENLEIEYQSDAEMAAAIASLEREIAAVSGVVPVRSVNVRSKGWS